MPRLVDLKVVDEDQFYYTNSINYDNAFETVFNLRWGSVGFYDGKHGIILESYMFWPSGMNTSPDGRF